MKKSEQFREAAGEAASMAKRMSLESDRRRFEEMAEELIGRAEAAERAEREEVQT